VSQSSYLFINGIRAHYLRWGVGQARQVVMLHGLASNARIWELTAPDLAAAGYDVAAPDGRGHGLTDKPNGDYGFLEYRHDLSALLVALDFERPILVGHSWGAMVALDYSATFSVGPRAPRGIILVDGGFTQLDQNGQTWEQMRERLSPPRLKGIPLQEFLNRFSESTRGWRPSKRIQDIVLANFEISPEETIAPRLQYENHMKIVRAMWEFQTYAHFSRLRCPVLMLPAHPPEPMNEMENEFLHIKQVGIEHILEISSLVRAHWMADSIHDIPLQRPTELARVIIDFAEELQ
jgi:pimeloyl-ACP methyl ester carboxylesterase